MLLDRAARLPIVFLLSPTNRNDLPFAYPLLGFARFVLALPLHVVRADGAYWGRDLVRFIVTVLGARPIIPVNRKKQPLARVRHLVWYRLSYAARAVIERFFAAAKRYDSVPSRVGDLPERLLAAGDLAEFRQMTSVAPTAGQLTNRLWNRVREWAYEPSRDRTGGGYRPGVRPAG